MPWRESGIDRGKKLYYDKRKEGPNSHEVRNPERSEGNWEDAFAIGENLLLQIVSGRGGIGRRARFRFWW